MATILIVDDRPSNRQFAAALGLVRSERPDLIITDILMPTMDGYEFVQHVRADPDVAPTPVIFYTATYSAPQAEKLAKTCGVYKVLSKPCEPQEILAAVNQALDVVDPAAVAPPVVKGKAKAGTSQWADNTMSLYIKDLEDVRRGFEDLASRGAKPGAKRDLVNDLSKKFADNVARMQSVTTRLSALHEVAMEMMTERQPARLVQLFFAAACDLVDSQYAAIGMRDETEQAIQLAFARRVDVAMLRGDAGRTGLFATLLSGRPVLRMRGADGTPNADGLPDGHPPVRDLLGIPVASADRVYGWMYFADAHHEKGFSDEDVRVVNAMARQLAVLYENAMLYDAIQRHAAELQVEVAERRRAQEALREREAGLRRAQVMAKLAHVVTRSDGSFESWSETLPQLVGVDAAQMPTSTREWLELLHAEDRGAFRARALEAATERERVDVEYRLRRADGAWRHIRQTMEPLSEADAQGKMRWFNTLQDVTERKRTEQNLRDSEARFRQMAENIRDVFFLVDAESNRVLYISPAYEEIWGRSCESVYANADSWTEAIHPEDRAATYESYKKGIAAAQFQYEYRVVRPDGSIRWIEARGFPIRDETGKVYRVTGVAEDITERKRAAEELRESERRFSDLLSNVEMVSLMLDRDARITYCNDYFLRLTGWQREEVIGQDWFRLFIPPDSDDLKAVFSALLANLPEARHHENEILTRAGARRLIRWNNSVLRSGSGETIGTASIGEDITAQKQAEIKIKGLNRVYAVLSEINTLIVRVRDRDELFREACRIAVDHGEFRMAWVGLVDAEAGVVRPVAWAGDVRGFFDSAPMALMENKPGGHGLAGRAIRDMKPMISNDVRNDPQRLMRKELDERGIRSLAVIPLIVGGEAIGVFAMYDAAAGAFDDEEMRLLLELAGDISFALEHIKKAEKLDYLAYYDQLTGLANRTLFLERVAQKLIAAGSSKSKVAVFALDVERFRAINDALGRQAGDELLKQVADRLRKAGGDESRLARIGGDDFTIVSAEAQNEEQLARLTELRLKECFGSPFRIGDGEVTTSAKVGIAVFPNDGADAGTLLRNAEAAVEKAKASGERYVFYTQEMTERIAEKLALESKLRQALEKEEFVLHYQPKVDLETRGIVGVEALIRWQSPERGLVPPLQFIPLLEETGLIQQVGSWALRRASLDHRSWTEQGLKAPRVAVNVSPIQMQQRNFVEIIEQAIVDGIAPTAIDLEITESLIMEDIQGNIQKLNSVRTLGVNIAIDDFGTGYSSLGYLAKLPVQSLKIDRSFINVMNKDPNAMTLVSTIISLAHSLRLKVIAEGVETEEQANFLRLLRCDEMQGYLFSKPLPMDALIALLRKSP